MPYKNPTLCVHYNKQTRAKLSTLAAICRQMEVQERWKQRRKKPTFWPSVPNAMLLQQKTTLAVLTVSYIGKPAYERQPVLLLHPSFKQPTYIDVRHTCHNSVLVSNTTPPDRTEKEAAEAPSAKLCRHSHVCMTTSNSTT